MHQGPQAGPSLCWEPSTHARGNAPHGLGVRLRGPTGIGFAPPILFPWWTGSTETCLTQGFRGAVSRDRRAQRSGDAAREGRTTERRETRDVRGETDDAQLGQVLKLQGDDCTGSVHFPAKILQTAPR